MALEEAKEMEATTEEFKNLMESRNRIMKIIIGLLIVGIAYYVFGGAFKSILSFSVEDTSRKLKRVKIEFF